MATIKRSLCTGFLISNQMREQNIESFKGPRCYFVCVCVCLLIVPLVNASSSCFSKAWVKLRIWHFEAYCHTCMSHTFAFQMSDQFTTFD